MAVVYNKKLDHSPVSLENKQALKGKALLW